MIAFAFALLLTLAPQQRGIPDVACPTFNATPDDKLANGSMGCVLDYQGMHFESDWLTYDRNTGDVSAGDHIHFTRGSEVIDGSHMEMNIETKAGKIWDATGTVEPGFHVTAKLAVRFEDESWEFHNTTITACNSPKPCWTIDVGRAWFRKGEWVRGKNAIFHFHGVPLVPLPYVSAPSEQKERSTGFLIPSISNSNAKGRAIREEFYYVINDSADASFVGEYFSNRGPTAEVNFRAKPTSTGWISVNAFFVNDRLDQGGHSLRILSFTNWGKYSRGVVDLETESSVIFRQVWGDSFNVIASPINRSVGYFTTNKPNSSFSLLYSRSEFLQTIPSATLRKFPSFEFSIPSHPMFQNLPAYFRFDGSLSGISRSDSAITTPPLVGRFDIHPSVEMPLLRLNAIELSQEAGIRGTGYTHTVSSGDDPNMLNRFTFDYAAHFSGPQFEKSYGKWRHSIQPTVDYRFVNGVDQFRDTIIVDDVDLVTDTNQVEYGITNRVLGARELLSFRVAQVAYFNPTFGGAIQPEGRNVFESLLGITGFAFADGPRHVSPIVSTLRWAPNTVNTVSLQVDYDTQIHRTRSATIISGLRKGKWASNVLYSFTKPTALQAPNNQIHGTLSYGNPLARGFSFATSAAYDVRQRLFQGAAEQVGYNTECYGFSLEFTQYNLGVRHENKWRFSFSLKNIGTFGTLRPQDRVF